MPSEWPSGSYVVLLDSRIRQILIPASARGVMRHFRYGPAKELNSSATYRYAAHAFKGNGLRPYPVAHLRGKVQTNGIQFSWIRCSRIDGDMWGTQDVPLGEEREEYRVKVRQNGVTVREEFVDQPVWTYTSGQISSEVGATPFSVEVAQISDRYGPGLPASLSVAARA